MGSSAQWVVLVLNQWRRRTWPTERLTEEACSVRVLCCPVRRFDLVEIVAIAEIMRAANVSEDFAAHQLITECYSIVSCVKIFEDPQQPISHFITSEAFQMQTREPIWR